MHIFLYSVFTCLVRDAQDSLNQTLIFTAFTDYANCYGNWMRLRHGLEFRTGELATGNSPDRPPLPAALRWKDASGCAWKCGSCPGAADSPCNHEKRGNIRLEESLSPGQGAVLMKRKQNHHRLGQHDRCVQRAEQKYPVPYAKYPMAYPLRTTRLSSGSQV